MTIGQLIVGLLALGIGGTLAVTILGWIAAGVSAILKSGRRH